MIKNMRKIIGLFCAFTLTGSLIIGCSDKDDFSRDLPEENAITPAPAEEENWQIELDSNAVQVMINNFETYQTIDGFGAAFAWYSDWMTNNPNDSETEYLKNIGWK